jgi:hypothetical protein
MLVMLVLRILGELMRLLPLRLLLSLLRWMLIERKLHGDSNWMRQRLEGLTLAVIGALWCSSRGGGGGFLGLSRHGMGGLLI